MHGQKLGINEPFLYKLVPTVGKIMESYYPEVLEKRDFIEKIVKSEEESFARTLHSGQHFAETIVADLKEKGQTVIAGQDVLQTLRYLWIPSRTDRRKSLKKLE